MAALAVGAIAGLAARNTTVGAVSSVDVGSHRASRFTLAVIEEESRTADQTVGGVAGIAIGL